MYLGKGLLSCAGTLAVILLTGFIALVAVLQTRLPLPPDVPFFSASSVLLTPPPTTRPTAVAAPATPLPVGIGVPQPMGSAAYFREIYLTSAEPASRFELHEKTCGVIVPRKTADVEIGIYDFDRRTLTGEKQLLQVDSQYTIVCPRLDPGRYEFRVWVGERLAVVSPFVVLSQDPSERSRPNPAATEIGDYAVYQEYFASVYMSRLARRTFFSASEQIFLAAFLQNQAPAFHWLLFDLTKKKQVAPRTTIPGPLDSGFYLWKARENSPALTPGHYECRYGIGDLPDATLSFEIK